MFSRSFSLCLVLICGWLCSAPALSQDEELQRKINRAIEKGIASLKRIGGEDALWYGSFPPGPTALAAWSLLESGVKESDAQVQKAAANIRKDCLNLNKTYALALAILFFDRLGDPGDEPLIQALGARLMAGQRGGGPWTYDCPVGDDADRAWLEKQIEEADKHRKDKTASTTDKKTLLPQIQKQIEKFKQKSFGGFLEDNSNTQFAMLALWVARRHGLPVDDNLERVAAHFRNSQLKGGGWNYSSGSPPRATMTCAGLLGLAIGEGIKPKKAGQGEQLKKDPKVKNGLELLGNYLKNPDSPASKRLLEKPGMFNYFLFSMERMAVVYDLKTIGEHDWYVWGARILVDKQNGDGSWYGEYGPAETSFALLFLRRANVAEDLTFMLQGIVKPPPKKKLKKSLREEDPFDLPPDKEKKKIKIRPKDKQSGLPFVPYFQTPAPTLGETLHLGRIGDVGRYPVLDHAEG